MKAYRIEPDQRVKLKHFDPDEKAHLKDKAEAVEILKPLLKQIHELQTRLYAESRQALLIVLQAMDTGGKDGVVRSVMSGVNPSSCRVVPFKVPSSLERAHDFLWRIHKEVPPKGYLTIFNRSHYEDVLVTRVHGEVSDELAEERFEQIRHFEKLLHKSGTRVIKFFLHISKDEQRERLETRVADPLKRWKFNIQDLLERKQWNSYMKAYEEALSATSTKNCPWYVIPSNHKWVRNVLVARAIVKTLEDMNPQIPRITLPKNLRIR